LQPTRPVTRGTGASGQVLRGNSSSQGRSDARHVRSHAIGRIRSLRELIGLKPDAGTVASGRCVERVQSCRCARGTVRSTCPVIARGASGRCFTGLQYCAIGASGRLSGASGRLMGASGRCLGRVQSFGLTISVVTVGGSDAVERVRSVSTGTSGHPEKDPVKGYNGSIRLECL
jgi:hypothetical protein